MGWISKGESGQNGRVCGCLSGVGEAVREGEQQCTGGGCDVSEIKS